MVPIVGLSILGISGLTAGRKAPVRERLEFHEDRASIGRSLVGTRVLADVENQNALTAR